MEVIRKGSIRPLMGVHQQGELALCIGNHSIRIQYTNGGRYLDCTVDGHAQECHDINGVYQCINAVTGGTEKGTTMNKDLKEEFERNLAAMPPRMQGAVIWVIQHFDIVKALAKYEPMSDEKLDVFTKSSLQKEEYLPFIIAAYTRLLRKEKRDGCHN